MAVVKYEPTFQHAEWVDNVDRVQAGGGNGFNVRFNSIEAEFHAISQAVQVIDTALSSLGEEVRAAITIGLTPVLLPFGGKLPWSPISWSQVTGSQPLGTFVEKPVNNDQAWGVMPLGLPNDVRLTAIKVLGEQTGPGTVTTELVQEARAEPFTKAVLVTVTGLAAAADAPTPIPGTPAFDGANNLYYLLVRVEGAAAGASGSSVRLRGFQVTYQP